MTENTDSSKKKKVFTGIAINFYKQGRGVLVYVCMDVYVCMCVYVCMGVWVCVRLSCLS